MTSKQLITSRRGAAALGALALVAGALLAAGPAAAEDPPNPLPVFEFGGIITDKSEMKYNPTNEYIFPSIFHAGEHFENPLAEWYLYYAPHNSPGGISLMYSDSLDGPWTEYEANPIIGNTWLPHYESISHISSPDAFWHEAEQTMFMYFHGENSVTRFATTDDGITFEYGHDAVTNADGGPGTSETSYARVFDHPDENSAYNYAMFYMDNTPQNIRRIRLAESVDARTWDVRVEPLVVPGAVEGQNVSSANLWEWEGQLYVIYHASSGRIHARATNASFTELGPTLELHRTSGVGDDSGRTAAPDIITYGGETYLFYEAGDRLGATIAFAKLNPDIVRDEDPGPNPHPDPSWDECQGAGSDEFDGTELDRELWPHIIREQLAAHTVGDGALVVPTYRAGVNGVPLIQQDVPSGEWEATTKLSIDPAATFQQAGLLLYRDDTNYAKFDLVQGSFGLRLEYIWRQNGSDRNASADSQVPSPALGESIWLRLSSDGSQVRASVSYDGQIYAPFGRTVTAANLAADRIGPFAMRGATAAPEINATFDWFRWSPNAEELEACEEPEIPDDSELAAPGRAVLGSTSGWSNGLHDGNYAVRMNLWWGTNGSVFRLFENGELIATESLTLESPAAQSAAVSIADKPNGTYVYTGELVNSQGVTATRSITVTVTDANPGRPVLSHNNRDRNGEYTLTANLWWGTNATSYRILEDGAVIATGELAAATPSAQRATFDVVGAASGTHTYVVEFANAAGTTTSAPVTVGVR